MDEMRTLLIYAVLSSRIEMAKHLVMLGAPVSDNLIDAAIKNCSYKNCGIQESIEFIKFLHEVCHIKIDRETMNVAVVSNVGEIVEYLFELGCPHEDTVVQNALRGSKNLQVGTPKYGYIM